MNAEELREDLLANCDLARAAELAEQITNDTNAIINEAGVSVGTSLAARALLVNGLLSIAADWWAMMPNAPAAPVCRAALQSIADRLPWQLEGGSFIDPALVQ